MLANEEEDDDEVGEVLTLPLQAHHAMEKMEEFVHKVKMFVQSDKHRFRAQVWILLACLMLVVLSGFTSPSKPALL